MNARWTWHGDGLAARALAVSVRACLILWLIAEGRAWLR
jgi:hypothetical protein